MIPGLFFFKIFACEASEMKREISLAQFSLSRSCVSLSRSQAIRKTKLKQRTEWKEKFKVSRSLTLFLVFLSSYRFKCFLTTHTAEPSMEIEEFYVLHTLMRQLVVGWSEQHQQNSRFFFFLSFTLLEMKFFKWKSRKHSQNYLEFRETSSRVMWCRNRP